MNPTQLPPRVIGITGQKGHGKNLLASFIVNAEPEFLPIAFADPLKHAASEIFDVDLERLYDVRGKEVPFDQPIHLDLFLEPMREYTKLDLQPKGEVAATGRELLQKFGTDYVRATEPNYWVNRATEVIQGRGMDVVIPDVRFANEADAVRRMGGVVVRVLRDGRVDKAEHASEEINFPVDAAYYIGSGDFNKVRDVAFATVALASGKFFFAQRQPQPFANDDCYQTTSTLCSR